MASLGMFTLSIVILLLVGSVPCRSTECTPETVRECSKSRHFIGYCPFFQDVVDCLEDLKPSCTDDTLIVEVSDSIEFRRTLSTTCLGVTNGCYMDGYIHCQGLDPTGIIVHKGVKPEHCKTFLDEESEARLCYADLKTRCNSTRTDNHIAEQLHTLNDTETSCKKAIELTASPSPIIIRFIFISKMKIPLYRTDTSLKASMTSSQRTGRQIFHACTSFPEG